LFPDIEGWASQPGSGALTQDWKSERIGGVEEEVSGRKFGSGNQAMCPYNE